MIKTLLASAGLSCAFILLPLGTAGPISIIGTAGLSSAKAIEIGVDVGGDDEEGGGITIGGGDDDDEGEGGGISIGIGGDGDDADDDEGDSRISCSRGRRAVEKAGFRNVRERNCKGDTYRYTGSKKGDNFEVRVSSRNGRIVSVRKR
jgi:hypothetical protein